MWYVPTPLSISMLEQGDFGENHASKLKPGQGPNAMTHCIVKTTQIIVMISQVIAVSDDDILDTNGIH